VAVLDIDVGNTRCKWRLSGGDRMPAFSGSCALDDLQRALASAEGAPAPQRIRVASVKGDVVAASLGQWARERFGIEPEFAATERTRNGLTNSYAEPGRLGVDRWLAMLAGWSEHRAAVCIVDCGSAITVDLVDDTGMHRGGYITPGLVMMRESLLRDTARVRFDGSPAEVSTSPGCDTAHAVYHGTFVAAVGAVERACRIMLAMCADARVLITGGDAPAIGPELGFGVEQRPDLVLDGLGIALP